MTAFVATGEETGPAGPAGGGGDEGIFKAHPLRGESIKVRGLHHGVPSAAEGVIALVVRKKEEDVGPAGAGGRKKEAQEDKAETWHGG